jgi:hypothetical protein
VLQCLLRRPLTMLADQSANLASARRDGYSDALLDVLKAALHAESDQRGTAASALQKLQALASAPRAAPARSVSPTRLAPSSGAGKPAASGGAGAGAASSSGAAASSADSGISFQTMQALVRLTAEGPAVLQILNALRFALRDQELALNADLFAGSEAAQQLLASLEFVFVEEQGEFMRESAPLLPAVERALDEAAASIVRPAGKSRTQTAAKAGSAAGKPAGAAAATAGASSGSVSSPYAGSAVAGTATAGSVAAGMSLGGQSSHLKAAPAAAPPSKLAAAAGSAQSATLSSSPARAGGSAGAGAGAGSAGSDAGLKAGPAADGSSSAAAGASASRGSAMHAAAESKGDGKQERKAGTR